MRDVSTTSGKHSPNFSIFSSPLFPSPPYFHVSVGGASKGGGGISSVHLNSKSILCPFKLNNVLSMNIEDYTHNTAQYSSFAFVESAEPPDKRRIYAVLASFS